MTISEAIKDFIDDELKNIRANRDNISGIKHEDIDHYRGVIEGKTIAYAAVLSELRRLK